MMLPRLLFGIFYYRVSFKLNADWRNKTLFVLQCSPEPHTRNGSEMQDVMQGHTNTDNTHLGEVSFLLWALLFYIFHPEWMHESVSWVYFWPVHLSISCVLALSRDLTSSFMYHSILNCFNVLHRFKAFSHAVISRGKRVNFKVWRPRTVSTLHLVTC